MNKSDFEPKVLFEKYDFLDADLKHDNSSGIENFTEALSFFSPQNQEHGYEEEQFANKMKKKIANKMKKKRKGHHL